jgi:hypothetical protein
MNTVGSGGKRQTNKGLILVVISLLVVAVICSSSAITLRVLAEPSGKIGCERTGTLKVKCCQEHIINRSPANPAGTLVNYCTDCELGPGGTYDSIHNCSERYIEAYLEQPPPISSPTGPLKALQESGGFQSGVLGKVTTLPNLSQSMGQNFGGLLQNENNLTFSQKNNGSNNDSSDNNTLALNQSDSVLHTGKKATKAMDNEVQEQDDSSGGANEGSSDDNNEVDEPQHQGKINED